MLLDEAQQIFDDYFNHSLHNESDENLLMDALKVICDESDDMHFLLFLACKYERNNRPDLAEKVIDYCISKGYGPAYLDKAFFIKTYEEDDNRKYEKLYHIYMKCLDDTIETDIDTEIIVKTDLAHMYKDGLYVRKDFDKYKEIINSLYEDMMSSDELHMNKYMTHHQDVYYEKGLLAEEERDYEMASFCYRQAINYYILYMKNMWPLEYENMQEISEIVNRLYSLIEFDDTDMNLLDLLFVSAKISEASFMVGEGEKHTIQFFNEENGIVCKYNEKWYRSVTRLLYEMEWKNEKMYTVINDIFDWELIYRGEE